MRIKGGKLPEQTTIYYFLIIILVIFIFIVGLFYVVKMTGNNAIPAKLEQNITVNTRNRQYPDGFYNVYEPPLRENPYMVGLSQPSAQFTQMGILKSNDGSFLPLFGRPLSTGRDLWNYYAISNTGTIGGIKLNIRNERGRNLMDDTGNQPLNDRDTVVVDGYDTKMEVSLYPQKNITYTI